MKCLYFDGASAALFGTGQLDSQMVFLYGNVSGPPPPERGAPWLGLFDEYGRARDLCGWVQSNNLGGLGWGIEGIVRMNAGFEMIWCNFSSPSIRLLTHLNVTAPLTRKTGERDGQADGISERQSLVSPRLSSEEEMRTSFGFPFPLPPSPTRAPDLDPEPLHPPGYGGDRKLEPFWNAQRQEWFRSATWHYGASGMGPGRGERRVQLLTCGFSTYYSANFHHLAASRSTSEQRAFNLSATGAWQGPGKSGNRTTALQQLSRRRRSHTLAGIDATGAVHMNTAVADFLQHSSKNNRVQELRCSGMDWAEVSQEIAVRYSTALHQLLHFISHPPSSSSNHVANRDFLSTVRVKAHALLLPFLEYPDSTDNMLAVRKSGWSLQSSLGQITLSRCKYAYTRLLYDSEGSMLEFMSGPERVVIEATENVLDAICSSIIQVGFEVESMWKTYYGTANTISENMSSEHLYSTSATWTFQLEELIAWLGWAGDEVRCEKLCGRGEYCAIPMWPLSMFGGGRERRGHYFSRNGTYSDSPDQYGPHEDGGHPPYEGTPPRDDGRRHRYGSQPPGRGPPGRGSFDQDLWTPKCVKVNG